MDHRPFSSLFQIPLRNGLTKPKRVRGSGFKMINMGELFKFSRIKNIEMDRVPLNDKEKKLSMLQKNDLLFARQSLVITGAGQCSIFLGDKEEVCFESHIIRCRLNENLAYPLFYYYFFKSNLGKNTIRTIVEQGAGASGIRGSDLSKLQIPYFELHQQKNIAHILSTLDDKIDLNCKMNQTLEEMAQALFKSWFVDFDPVHSRTDAKSDEALESAAAELGLSKEVLELFPSEFEESEMGMIPLGWEVKTIKDFGRVITGKTPPKKIEDAYSDKGTPFITPTDVYDSLFVANTVRYLSKSGQLAVKNSKITGGSICVTCIGSQMGKTTVAYTDSFTNQQINSIVLTKKYLRNYLLCNLRGRKKEIFLLGSGGGSTMPLLNKSSFEKVDVLLPSIGVVEAFDNIIKDNISLVLQNDIENNSLSNLRDTLLPKLLSGELDVSELEIK